MDRKKIAHCIGVSSALHESLREMQANHLPANSTLLSRAETKSGDIKQLLFELYEEIILAKKE